MPVSSDYMMNECKESGKGGGPVGRRRNFQFIHSIMRELGCSLRFSARHKGRGKKKKRVPIGDGKS